MKKISLLAACIAVITTFFSCSKQQDQYCSPAAQQVSQTTSKVPGKNGGAVAGSDDQKKFIKGFNENTNSLFGGGDDDKPIIMHRVSNLEFGPLQNAVVMMIHNTDSLHSLTDANGECTFELPHVGTWELKIDLSRFISLDTSISVTDSFSVKTTSLQHQ